MILSGFWKFKMAIFNIFRYTFSFRIGDESSFHFAFVPVEPVDLIVLALGNAGEIRIGLGSWFQSDDISWFQAERRNIHHFAVNGNVLVRNQLTGTGTGRGYAQPVNGIVKPGFEQADKVFTCNTLEPGSLFECLAELAFEQTISILRFLFFFQLQSIFTWSFSFPGCTVLTGRNTVLVQPLAITENGFAELAGDFGLGTDVTC